MSLFYYLLVQPCCFELKMFRPIFSRNSHILEFPVLTLLIVLCCYVISIKVHNYSTLYVKQPKPLPLFTMKFQFTLYKKCYIIRNCIVYKNIAIIMKVTTKM